MNNKFNINDYDIVFDKQEPQQQESFGGKVGRNIERIIPEIAGSAYGAPGDILQLGEGLGNTLIQALTGKENVIPQVGGKYIPTSEQLTSKMRSRQQQVPGYEGNYLQPQSDVESALSEGAKFAGSGIGSGALGEVANLGKYIGLGKQSLKGLSAGSSGTAVGDYVGRSLGINEDYLPLFRFGGAVGPSITQSAYAMINPKKIEKTASDFYKFARDNAPEKPFKATPLREVYAKFDDLRRSANTDSDVKKFINKQLTKIAEPASTNMIGARQALDLKENLSDTFSKITGHGMRKERKLWHELNEAVKDVFKVNAKQAPEFTNAVLQGNDMFRALNNRFIVSDVLKDLPGGKKLTALYPLYELFTKGLEGASKSLPKVAGVAGAAKLGAESYNVINNIMTNPGMRKYYAQIWKGALENNKDKIRTSFIKLNDLYKKENKNSFNPNEWTIEV